MTEHVDVLIVGAGLSGIGAATHLKRECPDKDFLLLESRNSVGGTWDLFRYPGIRSDSDMFTLGYSFRPWTDAKAIADGDSIHDYIDATVAEEGLGQHIRLNTRVLSAEWSSTAARWTITAVRTGSAEYAGESGETVTFTCSFLSVCSGYYRYDEGFTPTFPGSEEFGGTIVHPQHWPADLDYTDKRVVIIGSGATAVTLVPSIAKQASHVTMLQRSPTYIAPVPSRDKGADRLRAILPPRIAYGLVRAKNILYSMFTYQLSRRRPELMKSILRKAAVARLPEDFDVDVHLAPTYNPWDQRLCAIPDADLFTAVRNGSATIVTDQIDRIVPEGIRLASQTTLPADIIVTATGLNLLIIGGMSLAVDGRRVDVSQTLAYKGMMLSGVPNFALTIGYTNASWTLKADLVAQYVCRLLNYMDRRGFDTVTPHASEAARSGPLSSLIELNAGYITRSEGTLPRQGAHSPWRLHQNYFRDFALLRVGGLAKDVSFGRRGDPVLGEDPLALTGTAMLDLDGTAIRYRVTGSGTPVLALHGIGQSLEDWNEQHDRLSADHTVYSLDLPGFAYSDRLPGKASMARLAGVLPKFLDLVGVTEPLPVIGNSLGGAIAMTLAVAHPERVCSLVLVDSAGFGKEVTMALRLLAIKQVGVVLMRPSRKNSARTVDGIFYNKEFVTADRIDHNLALSQRPPHAATLLDLANELGTFRGVREQWRAELLAKVGKLDIPMLIMWGDHDHVLPFTHFDAAARALPEAHTHVFRAAGHMPQIEQADEFATVVEDFLNQSSLTAVKHDRKTAAS
jgi:cation diffusion facilitator CzcD-associated flavoprotein CzcO/pimeloyl-ACP methyl ester carboxylesterase